MAVGVVVCIHFLGVANGQNVQLDLYVQIAMNILRPVVMVKWSAAISQSLIAPNTKPIKSLIACGIDE